MTKLLRSGRLFAFLGFEEFGEELDRLVSIVVVVVVQARLVVVAVVVEFVVVVVGVRLGGRFRRGERFRLLRVGDVLPRRLGLGVGGRLRRVQQRYVPPHDVRLIVQRRSGYAIRRRDFGVVEGCKILRRGQHGRMLAYGFRCRLIVQSWVVLGGDIAGGAVPRLLVK